jgi:hypothetical protein
MPPNTYEQFVSPRITVIFWRSRARQNGTLRISLHQIRSYNILYSSKLTTSIKLGML